MLSTLRTFARWLSIDNAVAYALLTRVWQLIGSPVTLLLIARYFDPETQGYYYTFASLLAAQSFFELGMSIIIMNVASHEWVHLRMAGRGAVSGDGAAMDNLASLGRFVITWYGVASALFMILAAAFGYMFLSRSGGAVRWQAPWLALVVITGLQLLTNPFNSMLEGCGQIAPVSRLRLAQSVFGNIAIWIFLIGGGRLWVPVASAFAILALNLAFLTVSYSAFFKLMLRPIASAGISWRADIWPMQWRLAVLGIVNYFAYSLFTPVLFHYHGAAIAGRMGMTLQILNMIQSTALAWVLIKAPSYAALVAKKEFQTLDQLWTRNSLISIVVMSTGTAALLLLLAVLRVYVPTFAARVLGMQATAILGIAFIGMLAIQCMATYMRAHKREALTLCGLTSGLLYGALIWRLGRNYGAEGAALAYLLVLAFVNLPWVTLIWLHAKKDWHA